MVKGLHQHEIQQEQMEITFIRCKSIQSNKIPAKRVQAIAQVPQVNSGQVYVFIL